MSKAFDKMEWTTSNRRQTIFREQNPKVGRSNKDQLHLLMDAGDSEMVINR